MQEKLDQNLFLHYIHIHMIFYLTEEFMTGALWSRPLQGLDASVPSHRPIPIKIISLNLRVPPAIGPPVGQIFERESPQQWTVLLRLRFLQRIKDMLKDVWVLKNVWVRRFLGNIFKI